MARNRFKRQYVAALEHGELASGELAIDHRDFRRLTKIRLNDAGSDGPSASAKSDRSVRIADASAAEDDFIAIGEELSLFAGRKRDRCPICSGDWIVQVAVPGEFQQAASFRTLRTLSLIHI